MAAQKMEFKSHHALRREQLERLPSRSVHHHHPGVVGRLREHVPHRSHHLVEHHDGRLGDDDLAQTEVDALALHAVRDLAGGLLLCSG